MAADHGIRVFTVGFGSPAGGPAMMDGYSIYMAYDEATLKSIAELTEAEYFHAASADELKRVYQALSGKFVLAKEEREVTALAAALAACSRSRPAASRSSGSTACEERGGEAHPQQREHDAARGVDPQTVVHVVVGQVDEAVADAQREIQPGERERVGVDPRVT
jgi:hypothetical protein